MTMYYEKMAVEITKRQEDYSILPLIFTRYYRIIFVYSGYNKSNYIKFHTIWCYFHTSIKIECYENEMCKCVI